jgi:hypothetical protein
MTYDNINFHLPDSNMSLVIVIEPKAKESWHMAAILLLYNLQKKISESNILLKDLLPYMHSGS